MTKQQWSDIEGTAVLDLQVEATSHDPQQLDVVVKCHFCKAVFNQFVAIDEMEVCGGDQ